MRLAIADFRKVGPFKELSLEFKENKRKDLAEVHIFTGPNGSGKSTILRGLSRPFMMDEEESLIFRDLFWTQRERGSYIGVVNSEGERTTLSANLFPSRSNIELIYREAGSETGFERYFQTILQYRKRDKTDVVDYGVFGYSGKRPLNGSYGSGSGDDIVWNPFEKAVSFEREPDSELSFDGWVITAMSKAALALQSGNEKKYKAARLSLDKMEEILREITGRRFKFEVDLDVYEVFVNLDGNEFGTHVLPDGLKSILGWLGDLMMRMENIRWAKAGGIFEQPIILFLDEIDIHLHPEWQRRILPIIQKTFVNAQIFVSTHSPFVVASVEDAFVYDLNINKQGEAFLEQVVVTEKGHSYQRVLSEIFDIKQEFVDPWTEKKLADFYTLLNKTKSKKTKSYDEVFSIGRELANASVELQDVVTVELNQLDRRIAATK